MDNSNNLSNLQSIDMTSGNISENISENTNSFFDWLRNIPFAMWILIIFILAFLGINIFSYLSQGTQEVTNIFQPIIDSFAALFSKLTGQVVNVTAQGGKEVVNATAGVLDAGLTDVQQLSQGQLPSPSTATSTTSSVPVQSTMPQPDVSQANSLNKALNTYNTQAQGTDQQNYQADEASSSIQSAGSGKAGWCYVGEEKGFRSCAEVGVNDTCMSGDIFPTQEICINPSLRN